MEALSEWSVKIGALYYLQVKMSWRLHLTPLIITRHAQRQEVASKTQDTTIEFGIIITKDEIGMKGDVAQSQNLQAQIRT